MDPDAWLAQLTASLRAADQGVAEVAVTELERDALLDLARIAAHTSERWTAPVSTFLAGVAFAGLPADRRATAIRDLVDALEDPDAGRAAGTPTGTSPAPR